jgi:glycosyltransferase involved in cell wall biosynthesis
LRAAIVHEFFCNLGGSDQVAAALHQLFPTAPVYTLLISDRNRGHDLLKGMDLRFSFVDRLPFARRWHEPYLPFLPLAIESFDLADYDLVLSSSHLCAKGAIPSPEALHLCYCHTPARYAWDLYPLYGSHLNPFFRVWWALFMHWFRVWDVSSSLRVDHFIANSRFVARRIQRYYHRTATVIHPPVATGFFTPGGTVEDYYLVVSRLTTYKRIELAVEAFNQLGRPLLIIGDGPARSRLERDAASHIRFLGALPREEVRGYMQTCRALVFPGKEDFGITPVEVQATGRPVLAFGAGGVSETVVDGVTGVFFSQQASDAICEAVSRLDELKLDPDAIRKHALQFDQEVFRRKIMAFVREKWDQHRQ